MNVIISRQFFFKNKCLPLSPVFDIENAKSFQPSIYQQIKAVIFQK